jgi:hypothetical protein
MTLSNGEHPQFDRAQNRREQYSVHLCSPSLTAYFAQAVPTSK